MVSEEKPWRYNFTTNSGVLTFSLGNTVDENVVGDNKDQRSVHEIVGLTSPPITLKTDFPFNLLKAIVVSQLG